MKRPKPQNVNRIYIAVLIVGAVTGLYGAQSEKIAFFAASMVIIVGDMLFRILFYRCPHCGKFLDRSSGRYCPHCGEDVNE